MVRYLMRVRYVRCIYQRHLFAKHLDFGKDFDCIPLTRKNYSETQNRLSQAIYGFIVTSLQYKQAIGTLRPEDIVKINEQFN